MEKKAGFFKKEDETANRLVASIISAHFSTKFVAFSWLCRLLHIIDCKFID
jgi:hypothetical protein